VAGDIPGKEPVDNVDFEDMVGFAADDSVYDDHMVIAGAIAAGHSTADPDTDTPCCPAAVMGNERYKVNKGVMMSDYS